MRLPAPAEHTGWQPLTPRGMAAFAGAPLARLLIVQFVFAAFIAGAGAWFLSLDWFPAVQAAIRQLPPHGEIRSARMDWAEDSPRLLSENGFLAFVVDLNHTGQVRSPAHIQVEFGRNTIRLYCLLGYLDCLYPNPPGQVIPFNRPELEAWWGAWAPPMLWAGAALTIAGLLTTWALLALAYSPAVRLIGFFGNRELTWAASWKLAGAALMPGALLMTVAVVLYGLGALNLLAFLLLTATHVVAGWIYTGLAPWFAPRSSSAGAVQDNPFQAPTRPPPGEDGGNRAG